MTREHFLYHFPWFRQADAHLDSVLAPWPIHPLEKGAVMLRSGESCRAVPFVLGGRIRVFQRAEDGREVTLYHIEAGEACVLSATCAVRGLATLAEAQVSEAGQAVFVPASEWKRLVEEEPLWRSFAFELYARRLTTVLATVEAVTFHRMEERLWADLQHRADPEGCIATTHEALARDLGTSREVITRLLRDWEQQGRLETRRGQVRLLPGGENPVL